MPSSLPSSPASRVAATEHISGLSIGDYLIRRLQDYGLRDLFGIPGDYILSFYTMLEKSPLNIIGCCSEDSAGFAADAYARINGLGAVCVTYCVGGLKLCNPIAGAYAEKSPVVVISGAPGMGERFNNPLLHHKIRDFHTQREVFERLCVAWTELTDPTMAFSEIDRVLDACTRYKRPVYIELPRDMVKVIPETPYLFTKTEPKSDPEALKEAADEAVRLINQSQRPVILAGVEIHRFGLQSSLLQLAEQAKIPITATVLGKSVVCEMHPLYVGLYEGAMGDDSITRFVEESDCLVMLGTFMTDINMGIYTANLDPRNCIYATSEQLRIHHHHYHDVLLGDFIAELVHRKPRPPWRDLPKTSRLVDEGYQLRPNEPVTIERLIARLNLQLNEKTVVIADVGDSLFAATELVTRGQTEFVSPAYYTSMGFSIPAALGAQAARPDLRVIAIVGDGAFQMNGMEISTIVRRGYDPIVIILDNQGYGTERCLHPGEFAFNEIQPWKYHKLPEIIGGGKGYEIRTEGEFDAVLKEAWENRKEPSILQVHIARGDTSKALRRLAERLGHRV